MRNLRMALVIGLMVTVPARAQDLWPDYAGKQSCFGCHVSIKPIDLNEFNKSGHPWKVQPIDRSKVDANGYYKPFPAGTNEAGVPLPAEAIAAGITYTGADTTAAFMIGGFGWKARWMNKDGYIYEGTKAQYNLGTIHPTLKGFGSYNAANVANAPFALRTPTTGLVYTCGGCHTTGWKAYSATTQPVRYNNLPGFNGTFFEWGVQCEGCHGPSKAHTTNPTVKPRTDGFEICKDCHARGLGTRIIVKTPAKQFLDHREQYDHMTFTKHRRTAKMTCVTCHDPHKSTVYDRGGLKTAGKTCQPCHPNVSNVTVTMVRAGQTTTYTHECNDCHMPYIGDTAVRQNVNRGDQASHMWKINVNPVNRYQGMFTADSSLVRIPEDSVVSHTLDFACLGCHTTKDLNWASFYAKDIHKKSIAVNVTGDVATVPSAFYLGQNYPNPFNPSTTITFGLPQASEVRIVVYDILGKAVATLTSGRFNAGSYTVTWNGRDAAGNAVASGTYMYRMETDYFIAVKRMALVK
jgi:protein-arginine kinase activator protein McsA